MLDDEVIKLFIKELDVFAMKTNEYQLISQVKSPFSASHSRPILPVHSQSNSQILNFKNDDIDLIDTKRKLSDTPTPSEYNSFT